MRRALTQRPSRCGGNPTDRTPTICVVDPQPNDYHNWQSLGQSSGVQIHFATSAEDALKFSRKQMVQLWIVNTTLAGLSGVELCGLLKSQTASTPVYVIADQYDPATERAAWQARASVFGCKGQHDDWLEQWLNDQGRRPMPRETTAALATASAIV